MTSYVPRAGCPTRAMSPRMSRRASPTVLSIRDRAATWRTWYSPSSSPNVPVMSAAWLLGVARAATKSPRIIHFNRFNDAVSRTCRAPFGGPYVQRIVTCATILNDGRVSPHKVRGSITRRVTQRPGRGGGGGLAYDGGAGGAGG